MGNQSATLKTLILSFIGDVNKPIYKVHEEIILSGQMIGKEEFKKALWELMAEGKVCIQLHNSPHRLSEGQKAYSIKKADQWGRPIYYYYVMK